MRSYFAGIFFKLCAISFSCAMTALNLLLSFCLSVTVWSNSIPECCRHRIESNSMDPYADNSRFNSSEEEGDGNDFDLNEEDDEDALPALLTGVQEYTYDDGEYDDVEFARQELAQHEKIGKKRPTTGEVSRRKVVTFAKDAASMEMDGEDDYGDRGNNHDDAQVEADNSSEDDAGGKRKPMIPDPLFDPEQDDKDERWNERNIAKRGMKKKGQKQTAGVLSCPACFATLCYDCQKHERYEMWRAMFVENVKTLFHHEIRPTQGDDDPTMKYYIAVCETCETHVATMDGDEVFHFFNVICN